MILTELDFSELQNNVAKSAEALYSACRAACADETLCGLAFLPDEDVQSFYWMANTTASLDRSTTAMHKEAAKHGGDQSQEEIRNIMQFACEEWAYGEETLDLPIEFDCDLGLEAIWTTFRNLGLSGTQYDEGFKFVRQNALEAIAKGLSIFREVCKVDDDFVTLVQVNDSADVDEILSLAQICNSSKVFQNLQTMFQDE